MDESAFDIAMKFVMQGGGVVWAESTLNVAKGDKLMHDFKPITDYDDYSNFFEVQSFDFAMNVEPEDAGSGNPSRAPGVPGGLAHQRPLGVQPGRAGFPGGHGPAKAGDRFQRWRSATEKDAQQMKFKLRFDSFRFTRVIDGASPLLFQYCSRQKPFESAALVKRVSTGLRGGLDRQSLAFMRIDFTKVMLKSVKWNDGALVTESCEFVCDSLSFQYCQQMPDGSLLDPPKEPTTWHRIGNSERKRQGGG